MFRIRSKRIKKLVITFSLVVVTLGALFVGAKVAIGEFIASYGSLGMQINMPTPKVELNPGTTLALKNIDLPAASNLGSYGTTVSQQLEIFKNLVDTAFLANIDAAANLSSSQKSIIRKTVNKASARLSTAFTTLSNTSTISELPADALLAQAFMAKPAKLRVPTARSRRVRAKFFKLPLNGKTPRSESKAIAVYQVNSYYGFLIHNLSNENSSGSLINQLKAIASTSQASYLEQLRTALNALFVSAIDDVTKQSCLIFKKLAVKRAAKNKKFTFNNFFAEGTNAFSVSSNNYTNGSTRAFNLGVVLEKLKFSAVITMDNVSGGPVQFTATLNPTTTPPTAAITNGTASFSGAFATLVGIIMNQFAPTLTLSANSAVTAKKIVFATTLVLIANVAEFTLDITVSRKGFINGTGKVVLPGGSKGLPMTYKYIGFIGKNGKGFMYQLNAFPASQGTGAHNLHKYTFSPS